MHPSLMGTHGAAAAAAAAAVCHTCELIMMLSATPVLYVYVGTDVHYAL